MEKKVIILETPGPIGRIGPGFRCHRRGYRTVTVSRVKTRPMPAVLRVNLEMTTAGRVMAVGWRETARMARLCWLAAPL